MSHTYATLEVSVAAHTEIADKLRAAGYDHAFDGAAIDMHGIGLVAGAADAAPARAVDAIVAAADTKPQAGLSDEFRGHNAALIASIKALIALNDDGALVPHGIGGHARSLLSSAAVRIAALTSGASQPEPVMFVSPKQLTKVRDPEDDSGLYLPTRKTARGNFTMPLYAAPQAAPVDPVQPEPPRMALVVENNQDSFEVERKRLQAAFVSAALALAELTSAHSFEIAVPNTTPPLFVALSERSVFATPPAAQGAEPAGDPINSPLPCDVTIGHTTFRKGVNLSTLVGYARRLQVEAYGEPPTPEQQAHNLAVLQGRSEGPLQGVPEQGADERAAGEPGFHEAQPTATIPDAADGGRA